MSDASVRVTRHRHAADGVEVGVDEVAHEEPLELRVAGASLAVVMRTPGHDDELARGFLVTERVIASPDQIVSLRHTQRAPDADASENVLEIVLAEDVSLDLDRLRRNLYASSSCGICGKATIEGALDSAPALEDSAAFAARTLVALPDALRAAQPVFARTGGLHAAALVDAEGKAAVVREDVGRHNAVDKVIGWAFARDASSLRERVLLVSGRVSYEIVQKALAARIPLVAAVGAPSSLAVRLAEAGRVGLIGFLRDGSFSVYAHPERVLG